MGDGGRAPTRSTSHQGDSPWQEGDSCSRSSPTSRPPRRAQTLKDSGGSSGNSMGILVLDTTGNVKVDKVGARSWGAGAGDGACLGTPRPGPARRRCPRRHGRRWAPPQGPEARRRRQGSHRRRPRIRRSPRSACSLGSKGTPAIQSQLTQLGGTTASRRGGRGRRAGRCRQRWAELVVGRAASAPAGPGWRRHRSLAEFRSGHQRRTGHGSPHGRQTAHHRLGGVTVAVRDRIDRTCQLAKPGTTWPQPGRARSPARR